MPRSFKSLWFSLRQYFKRDLRSGVSEYRISLPKVADRKPSSILLDALFKPEPGLFKKEYRPGRNASNFMHAERAGSPMSRSR